MTWFDDLPLGRHAPGDSPIHRLDPRAKLLAVALLLSGSFFRGSALSLLPCLPLLLYALGASGVGFGYFLKSFSALWSLLLFGALLHAVTTPGRPLWPTPVLGVAWTREGWEAGLKVAAQLALAMGYASLLTLTTPPEELVAGLSSLFAPLGRLGLPVKEFYNSVLIALQLLPALGKEFDAVLAARPKGQPFVRTLEEVLRRLLRQATALRQDAGAAPARLGSFRAADWAAVGLSALSLVAAFLLGRGGVA